MQFFSFEQFIISPKHGYIFFFTMEDYCGLCKQYETELLKHPIQKLIKVNTSNEEDLLSIGIKAVPCTRFYDTEEKVAYERYGVLYNKQLNELVEAFEAR